MPREQDVDRTIALDIASRRAFAIDSKAEQIGKLLLLPQNLQKAHDLDFPFYEYTPDGRLSGLGTGEVTIQHHPLRKALSYERRLQMKATTRIQIGLCMDQATYDRTQQLVSRDDSGVYGPTYGTEYLLNNKGDFRKIVKIPHQIYDPRKVLLSGDPYEVRGVCGRNDFEVLDQAIALALKGLQ